MAITIIIGNCGSGKTALMTHFLHEIMLNGSRPTYLRVKKEITHLRQLGVHNLIMPPQKHLCFSDYEVKVNRRHSSYKISGFEIGLPNPHFSTRDLPVGSTIFLDEAQRYYNSRNSIFLREEVYMWYQLHRHNKYSIYLVAQRLGNIDLNIRAIADKYIVIDKLDVKQDKYGYVKKVVWSTRVFTSCECAEAYQLGKDKDAIKDTGEVVKFIADYDVFSLYNSEGNKFVFYNSEFNKTKKLCYEYESEQYYPFTEEGIKDFNDNNEFIAPKGYYKDKSEFRQSKK